MKDTTLFAITFGILATPSTPGWISKPSVVRSVIMGSFLSDEIIDAGVSVESCVLSGELVLI
jgi:hypothetical protein